MPTLRILNLSFKVTQNNSFKKIITYFTAFNIKKQNASTVLTCSTQLNQICVKASLEAKQITSKVTTQPQAKIS